jgi:hypothetical protein
MIDAPLSDKQLLLLARAHRSHHPVFVKMSLRQEAYALTQLGFFECTDHAHGRRVYAITPKGTAKLQGLRAAMRRSLAGA